MSRRSRVAAACAIAGAWAVAAATAVAAASPTPGAPGGDPRSSGQGPGLVGDPGFAVLAVVGVAVLSVVVTLAWIRFTDARRGG